MNKNSTSKTEAFELQLFARRLDSEQLNTVIIYLRDWNTSPKHFYFAQALLQAILSSKRPEVRAGH